MITGYIRESAYVYHFATRGGAWPFLSVTYIVYNLRVPDRLAHGGRNSIAALIGRWASRQAAGRLQNESWWWREGHTE